MLATCDFNRIFTPKTPNPRISPEAAIGLSSFFLCYSEIRTEPGPHMAKSKTDEPWHHQEAEALGYYLPPRPLWDPRPLLLPLPLPTSRSLYSLSFFADEPLLLVAVRSGKPIEPSMTWSLVGLGAREERGPLGAFTGGLGRSEALVFWKPPILG